MGYVSSLEGNSLIHYMVSTPSIFWFGVSTLEYLRFKVYVMLKTGTWMFDCVESVARHIAGTIS